MPEHPRTAPSVDSLIKLLFSIKSTFSAFVSRTFVQYLRYGSLYDRKLKIIASFMQYLFFLQT